MRPEATAARDSSLGHGRRAHNRSPVGLDPPVHGSLHQDTARGNPDCIQSFVLGVNPVQHLGSAAILWLFVILYGICSLL